MSHNDVTIRWHGQACMTIVSPGGTTAVVDPFDPAIGYPLPEVEPEVVIVTHEHYDHANVSGLAGNPTVLHGLGPDGRWTAVDATVGDIHIRTVGTYHDEVRGGKRGLNAMVCLDAGGLAIVHCGDLGHVLSDEQIRAVGPVEVLIVPVGGVYTVDAEEAREVARQLAPRQTIIPIHFATPPLTISLDPVEPFLKGWPDVRRLGTNEVRITPKAAPAGGPEIVVLDWRSEDG